MKRHTVIIAALLLLAFAFVLGAAPAAGDAQKLSKKGEKLMAKFHKAIQEKKADEALGLIQQVIAADPGYAVAYHNQGVLLHQKGQVDEAIASFEKSLQLQPDYANAQNALRQSLFEAGKAALAAQDFAKSNAYLLKLKDPPFPLSAISPSRAVIIRASLIWKGLIIPRSGAASSKALSARLR